MSVSLLFHTVSIQEGSEEPTQKPLVQTPDWQSLPLRQALPCAHLAQLGPPQSASVSPGSFIPLEQDKLTATQTLLTQFPLWQSESAMQSLLLAHGLQ